MLVELRNFWNTNGITSFLHSLCSLDLNNTFQMNSVYSNISLTPSSEFDTDSTINTKSVINETQKDNISGSHCNPLQQGSYVLDEGSSVTQHTCSVHCSSLDSHASVGMEYFSYVSMYLQERASEIGSGMQVVLVRCQSWSDHTLRSMRPAISDPSLIVQSTNPQLCLTERLRGDSSKRTLDDDIKRSFESFRYTPDIKLMQFNIGNLVASYINQKLMPAKMDNALVQNNETGFITERSQIITGMEEFYDSDSPCLCIQEDIETYGTNLQLSTAVFIVALIYLDRIEIKSQLRINRYNVKRLTLTSIILSMKYMEDICYRNSGFAFLTDNNIDLINTLEAKFLDAINWELHVSVDLFNQYNAGLSRLHSIRSM